jgi:hypothetical protein
MPAGAEFKLANMDTVLELRLMTLLVPKKPWAVLRVPPDTAVMMLNAAGLALYAASSCSTVVKPEPGATQIARSVTQVKQGEGLNA